MTESIQTRPIILCFVPYYLPGYRSGGPVRTIANFADHLGSEFDIRIVTRDRDVLDTQPYPAVVIDAWNKVGNVHVFYASVKTVNLCGIAKLIHETRHDILYLNSFFAFGFTTLPLLARRLGLVPNTTCLIAPRGEFSSGALAFKLIKKKIYISLTKAFGLYELLHWQASSDFEKIDIIRVMGSTASWLRVATDLTPAVCHHPKTFSSRLPGPLRFIFLSRISPKKNLDFLLQVLAKVSANVDLTIYGPKEDPPYWKHCKILIDQLPENIHVRVKGQVPHDQVRSIFSKYDMFVFPTRGENFGHVIFESLLVGTPVLTSDQTPWPSDDMGGLQSLPLHAPLWVEAIEALGRSGEQVLTQMRRAAADYAREYSNNNRSLKQNRELFMSLHNCRIGHDI